MVTYINLLIGDFIKRDDFLDFLTVTRNNLQVSDLAKQDDMLRKEDNLLQFYELSESKCLNKISNFSKYRELFSEKRMQWIKTRRKEIAELLATKYTDDAEQVLRQVLETT